MVLSTAMKFSSRFSSPEIEERVAFPPPRSPARRRLDFSTQVIRERMLPTDQECQPRKRLYIHIPTSSESNDSEAERQIISEVVNKYVSEKEFSTSLTDSDSEREERSSIESSKDINLWFAFGSSQPFNKDYFVKEQTSEFYKCGYQLLVEQDHEKQNYEELTCLFNNTPSFAVDALICFYYDEKRIKGTNKRKLEKFLTEECFERMRDIPLKKRYALFQFLLVIEDCFPASVYALGRCYAVGFGTRRSMEKAKKALYYAATLHGDSRAQFMLGCICEFINVNNIHADNREDRHHEVTRCYTEAVRWYKQAHNNGLVCATFALACCYSSGIGVPKNLNKAFDFCRLALRKRLVGARFLISILYREGPEEKRNLEKSIKWCFKGVKYGEADFQAIYGFFSEIKNMQVVKNKDNCPVFEKRLSKMKKRLGVLRCVAHQANGKEQKEYWENQQEFPQEIGAEQNEQRRQFFLKKLMMMSKNQACVPFKFS